MLSPSTLDEISAREKSTPAEQLLRQYRQGLMCSLYHLSRLAGTAAAGSDRTRASEGARICGAALGLNAAQLKEFMAYVVSLKTVLP